MGLKDLFIVSDENSENKPIQEPVKQAAPSTTKFPSSTPKTEEPSSNPFSSFGFGGAPTPAPTPTYQATNVSNEVLAKTLEMYEAGFDSLNQPGYDFYEFFKAVMAGGVDNPAIYGMAFGMGSAMDKSITKDKLLMQSDFYITEINKVYNDYVAKGNGKRQEVINQKNHENESLVGELNLMRQQLEQLQVQISDRENKLSVIDSKYGPILNEVETKIAANDLAKQKIVGSIEQVKNGIINNLK
jgi:hypothetical protein